MVDGNNQPTYNFQDGKLTNIIITMTKDGLSVGDTVSKMKQLYGSNYQYSLFNSGGEGGIGSFVYTYGNVEFYVGTNPGDIDTNTVIEMSISYTNSN